MPILVVNSNGVLDPKTFVIVGSFSTARSHTSRRLFQGYRISIVAFTNPAISSIPTALRSDLRRLGFPLDCLDPRAIIALKLRTFLDICAGETAPITRALLGLGKSCLDPLDACADQGGQHHDIRIDAVFDVLIKLALSGCIAAATAGPPCNTFSRVRKIQPGPPELRTEDFPEGLPWIYQPGCEEYLRETQDGTLIHQRVIILLGTIYDQGGFVMYEQPPGSIAFCLRAVREFLVKISANIIQVAACQWGSKLQKSWACCASDSRLNHLASICPHPEGTHESIRGKSKHYRKGKSLSASSALYPPGLAKAFADAISPLLSNDIFQASVPWQRVHRKLIPVETLPPTRDKLTYKELLESHEYEYIGRGTDILTRSRWANPFSSEAIWTFTLPSALLFSMPPVFGFASFVGRSGVEDVVMSL